jgi:hypothetical protein
MLRDNEREGVSVDRGRTRVDGDKNGLRMGMSDLYPLFHSPFRSTTDHISLLSIIYNMSLELDSHHSHVHSYTQPRPHSNILADIYNGLAITSPRPQRARTQCRILYTMNTYMIPSNHLYPFPSPSSLPNCLLSRDLLLPMLFEPSLCLSPPHLHLHLPRSLLPLPLKQTH